MSAIQSVKMNNAGYIGIMAYEVIAIPTVGRISPSSEEAISGNRLTFLEMINSIIHYSSSQEVSIEILLATEKSSGQNYHAQIHIYIIIRRFGYSQPQIEESLSAMEVSIKTTLHSGLFVVRDINISEDRFKSIVSGISSETEYILMRSAKRQYTDNYGNNISYGDVIKGSKVNNYGKVFEALSEHPNSAISIQLIPAQLTQEETVGLIQTIHFLQVQGAWQARALSGGNEALQYYKHFTENNEGGLLLFGIFVFGSKGAGADIMSKLQTALQYGGDAGVGMSIENVNGIVKNYYSEFAAIPWNMITDVLNANFVVKCGHMPGRFHQLVTAKEASTFFFIPVDDGNLIGIKKNEVVGIRDQLNEIVTREDNIQFGHPKGGKKDSAMIGAPVKSFTRHTLIVGMPGTGKTTFSVNLLLQFYNKGIPFLAIEPTKSEYRAMIDAVENLQVFTPGKNSVIPFVMNPFLPPEDIPLSLFKPSLISAFKAAFSMPSPLDILFIRAINVCYEEHGWRAYSKLNDPGVKLFGLREFVQTFRHEIQISEYSAESKGNLQSAGVFRLMNLIEQSGDIYDSVNSVPMKDLLSKPTVLELNAIENQEQKALLMALLLIHIVLYTKHLQVGDGAMKNLILIDEAHVLLDVRQSNNTDAADASNSTVRALQDMIKEIRSYGTGIVIADQSPKSVTREIVGNTDIKICFRLVQSEDRQIIATETNMPNEEAEQLSKLSVGEAYVSFTALSDPVRIQTNDIREEKGIRLAVSDSELKDRMHYWDDKKELLKPHPECKCNDCCTQGCDFHIRQDGIFYADRIFSQLSSKVKDKKQYLSILFSIDRFIEKMGILLNAEEYQRLISCIRINFLRKTIAETPYTLSEKEWGELMNRWNHSFSKEDLKTRNTEGI